MPLALRNPTIRFSDQNLARGSGNAALDVTHALVRAQRPPAQDLGAVHRFADRLAGRHKLMVTHKGLPSLELCSTWSTSKSRLHSSSTARQAGQWGCHRVVHRFVDRLAGRHKLMVTQLAAHKGLPSRM